ncbi:3554_t:CDS:1, partial [Ambispora leptoticha]
CHLGSPLRDVQFHFGYMLILSQFYPIVSVRCINILDMSLSSLKTLAYNILKETGDIVQDTENLEPLQCSICKEKILTLTYESFTILGGCGHIFHRMCIEKKILYTTPSICPFTGCSRSVENIDETQRRVSVSSEIS